jgi:hypothetical protein
MADVTTNGAGEPAELSAADEQLLRELTERKLVSVLPLASHLQIRGPADGHKPVIAIKFIVAMDFIVRSGHG